jgi:hypothetical protein
MSETVLESLETKKGLSGTSIKFQSEHKGFRVSHKLQKACIKVQSDPSSGSEDLQYKFPQRKTVRVSKEV